MAQATTDDLLSLEKNSADTITVDGNAESQSEKKCPSCGFRTSIFHSIADWDDDIPNCGGCTANWISSLEKFEIRDNTAANADFVTADSSEEPGKCPHCRYQTNRVFSLPGWDDGICGGCFSDYIATEDVDLRRQQ